MRTADVNRNPRRWIDRGARIRVIEGWHPSRPHRVGYNLVVDGDWIGTFETLDEAADAAALHLPTSRAGMHDGRVDLLPYVETAR